MNSDEANAFCSAWEAAAGNPVLGREAYLRLLARYAEPHRHYHTIEHIRFCLNELAISRSSHQNHPAVRLSIWYHDAIYNPTREDNEAKSAELAESEMIEGGLRQSIIQEIVRIIHLTTHISSLPGQDIAALVCDIDLAILGQSRADFDQYECAIRAEYRHVPELVFSERRTDILRQFVARPAIYFTQDFRDRYESIARANLQRAIAKWSSRCQ